jgi:hypothetical protein
LRVRRKLPPTSDSICIHRAKLIDILGSTLPARQIHLSKRITRVDGTPEGAHHWVRGRQYGNGPRNDCRRRHSFSHPVAVTTPALGALHRTDDLAGRVPRETARPRRQCVREIWDENKRFLFVPMNAGNVFWLAVRPAPPAKRKTTPTRCATT